MQQITLTSLSCSLAFLQRYVWCFRKLPVVAFTLCVFGNFFFSHVALAAEQTPITLKKGDRIAILGNGLADRMQHDGWLETYLQARFPDKELVIRNLGFNGDELTIRLRSSGFGSPEDWLKRTEATVVFAFFGYNESFKGPAGLDHFKRDLSSFVQGIQKSGQRLVLFSPIAYDDFGDRLLPAGEPMNVRLLAYTKAMSTVAEQHQVGFVDLFYPSQKLFEESEAPLTINGIHLTDAGNRGVAQAADFALFGKAPSTSESLLLKIRDAVRDKNFHWFHRYRTTDGYSIFGGRKILGESANSPTNEVVMLRELEVLDAMTANRDQRIWAVAQGSDLKIDDSNTPKLIPVGSNKPGPLADGKYEFLDGEAAIKKMTYPKNMQVNLFASEKEFPLLRNPVQTAVDGKGRLWTAVWPSYPHWKPKDEMNDKLLIFEDVDGDGKADKCKVFADGLHNPTGFEFYKGGVYVAQVPDIWFFKDTDGDDVADIRIRVVGGIDSADTHHSINSFVVGNGGGLYFQEGCFHRTQAETPYSAPKRVVDAGVFRYDPVSQDFSPAATFSFYNPHGHVFTRWGDDIIHDGTTAAAFYGPSMSGRKVYPHKLAGGGGSGAPVVYEKRTRPCPGTAILSSSHFPEENRDTLLVCNVIGVQGIMQYKLSPDGAGQKGVEMEPLLMSSDVNFRPVDIEVGQDGAVYVIDWQNPLIGHMQHNLRDSNRDQLHGRIYRMTCKDRPLTVNPAIADEPIDKLLPLLTSRDNNIRYRVKNELSRHPAKSIQVACEKWLSTLDPSDENYGHHLTEALWVHQHHHVVNEPLLRKLLVSIDYRVRTAAAGVLRAWRQDISEANALIEKLVNDENPRVRLAGVLICSDIDSLEAAELALQAAKYPCDKFLDYALLEATKTLAPIWKKALAEDKPFCRDNPSAIEYLMRSGNPAELLALDGVDHLIKGVITFPGTKPEARLQALEALAKSSKKNSLKLLVEFIEQADASEESALPQIVTLLSKFKVEEIKSEEKAFLQLAKQGQQNATIQAALASIMRIDSSLKRVREIADAQPDDLLLGIQSIPEEEIRAKFYLYVRSQMLQGKDAKLVALAINTMIKIPGHEQEKLTDWVNLVVNKQNRTSALTAISSIPQANWDAKQTARLVAIALQDLAATEPMKRAEGDVFAELQLALQFAEVLPANERSDALAKLHSYGVKLVELGTIPHRMAFDQDKIAVQAGGTIRLVFENRDNMPHNFVLLEPGSLTEIGQLAEDEATDPKMIARHYVPESDKVLLATKLIKTDGTETLVFQAPQEPGVYPFVCTYPGHWRRMFGAFYVVENTQQYDENPEAYLVANQLAPQDEMLKYNRPMHKWTLEELKPALKNLAVNHSFKRGQELFAAASCATCHTVKDENTRFAPNLLKLDAKKKAEDILLSIIKPSHTIDKKYRLTQFLDDSSGKSLVGLVIEETDDEVTIVVDPLVSCEPVFINKEDIEERDELNISLMPSGLLDRFTEDEILEIIAYVLARGDKDAGVYKPKK